MNEHGYRLLEQFEAGPGGQPAATAYLDPVGVPTLWLGATCWPNGDPVRLGDICTPEQGAELTAWNIRRFEDAVDQYCTRTPTPNQRAAFTLFAYNVGIEAFKKSTVLARFNTEPPLAPQSVADAFGMWCKATSSRPDKRDLSDPYYKDIIGKDENGKPCWIGPNGQPCDYQRTYPGILRRHLSTALLSLDLDCTQACRKDTVSITSDRVWDERQSRWEDRVRAKTELADVLPTAKLNPLQEPIAAATPVPAEKQVGEAGTGKPAEQKAPVAQPQPREGAVPGAPVVVAKPAAPPVDPRVVKGFDKAGEVLGGKPKPPPAPLDPRLVLHPQPVPVQAIPCDISKNMASSERLIGMVLVGAGTLVQVVTLRLGIGNALGAMFFDLTRDPVVLTLAVAAVISLLGWATKHNGFHVFRRGAEKSTQLLH